MTEKKQKTPKTAQKSYIALKNINGSVTCKKGAKLENLKPEDVSWFLQIGLIKEA